MRHLSSSRPEGQCGLRRSLKVVWREEGGCSAKLRGQSAGVGPGLDPVLLTVPEVHEERTLTFLADVPLDGDFVTGYGLPESPLNLTPLKK